MIGEYCRSNDDCITGAVCNIDHHLCACPVGMKESDVGVCSYRHDTGMKNIDKLIVFIYSTTRFMV
jgi:hypothetical protein